MGPHVPPLSPQWPPTADQLAEITNNVHWELQAVAYDLGTRPHVTRDGRLERVAADLDALAHLLRQHAANGTNTDGRAT